ARVRPGEAVRVRFRHNGQDVGGQPLEAGQEQTVRQPVTLKPGENTLQIVAVNRDALAGHEGLETTERTLLVTYNPPKEEPHPVLALETVGSQKVEPGKVLVVDEPRVRL